MIPFIVVSGGIGKRFSTKIPKQYQLLKKKPIIYYTFKSLLNADVTKCILVIDYKYKDLTEKIIKPFRKEIDIKFAQKGLERQDSVINGLKILDKKYEWIAIHDVVRPFFSKELLNLLIMSKKGVECVIPGISIYDTIKKITKNNIVKKTINRKKIKKIGTPQIVNRFFYEKAICKMIKKNKILTDDSSIIELFNGKIRVVEVSEFENIKITTKLDLLIGEIILGRYYESRNRI